MIVESITTHERGSTSGAAPFTLFGGAVCIRSCVPVAAK